MQFDFARLGPLLFLLGIGGLIFLLLRRASRRLHHPALARETYTAETFPPPAEPTRVEPHEVRHWQVEMHATARDLKGEIDSKLAALQVLCGQAAAEALRLETAIRRAQELGLASQPDVLEAVERLTASDLQVHDSNTVALGKLPPTLECDDRLPRSEWQRAQVHLLAAGGQTAAAIAHSLGIPLGEVELILSLPAPSQQSRGAA